VEHITGSIGCGHAKNKFPCAAQEVPALEAYCGTTLKTSGSDNQGIRAV